MIIYRVKEIDFAEGKEWQKMEKVWGKEDEETRESSEMLIKGKCCKSRPAHDTEWDGNTLSPCSRNKLKVRESMQKRRQKECPNLGWGKPPRYNRTNVHMMSESGAVYRRLQTIRSPNHTETQHWEGAVDMGLTPNEEVICNWYLLGGKKKIHQWRDHQCRSSWPT